MEENCWAKGEWWEEERQRKITVINFNMLNLDILLVSARTIWNWERVKHYYQPNKIGLIQVAMRKKLRRTLHWWLSPQTRVEFPKDDQPRIYLFFFSVESKWRVFKWWESYRSKTLFSLLKKRIDYLLQSASDECC